MAEGRWPKEHLSEEEIRERVNRVMDHWQSYPDFAHLFDVLLRANDNMPPLEYARRWTASTGTRHDRTKVQDYRDGVLPPPYHFIRDIADHNMLRFHPERIRAAAAERPAGDQRTALFAAAGLIEVTPESNRRWNREVLAEHARFLGDPRHGRLPGWGDVMHKLIAFHTQGGRMTQDDVADVAHHLAGNDRLFPPGRIRNLLANKGYPTAEERLALAQAVGLDTEQVRYIEEGMETGAIVVGSLFAWGWIL